MRGLLGHELYIQYKKLGKIDYKKTKSRLGDDFSSLLTIKGIGKYSVNLERLSMPGFILDLGLQKY